VWNAGRVYFRTYLYVDTAPTADTTLISFRPNTAAIGELRLTTTGALQIRASGVQVTITPAGIAAGIAAAGIAADGTSVGIEGLFDSLSGQIQMQLKVFTGSNIKGTVADYDLGLLAASAGSQNTTGFNLGLVTATTATVYYSGIVLADNWIGRAPDPEMILLGGKWTPAAISII
jgi:hypothetical protein